MTPTLDFNLFTYVTAVADPQNNSVRPYLGRHLPPSIALHGLVKPSSPESRYPTEAKWLCCQIREARPFLVDFASRISDIFVDKGFIPVTVDPSSLVLRAFIMQTKVIASDVRNEKPSLRRLRPYRCPHFDASKLHVKYEDFPWTTEFPLERMCISEFRLRDVWKGGSFVRTAFRDIASVPLPGVPQHALSTQDPEERYIKRDFGNRTPRTTLHMPSPKPINRVSDEVAS